MIGISQILIFSWRVSYFVEVNAGDFILGAVVGVEHQTGAEVRAMLQGVDHKKWQRVHATLHEPVVTWLLQNHPYKTLTVASIVATTIELVNDDPGANPGPPKQVLEAQFKYLPVDARHERVKVVNHALAEATSMREPILNLHFKVRTNNKRLDFLNKGTRLYAEHSADSVRSMLRSPDSDDVFVCRVCELPHREGDDGRFQIPHLGLQPVCHWCQREITSFGQNLKPPQVLKLAQIKSTSAWRLSLSKECRHGRTLGITMAAWGETV